MKKLLTYMMAFLLCLFIQTALAEDSNYILGSGDLLKINVYGNPDLTIDTRVTEGGYISFPMIGEVQVGGITPFAAEKRIADLLKNGGFITNPQVNILVSQFQSKLVSVLGSVNKPGRYPLDRATNLADLIALVGGVTLDGSDIATVVSKTGKVDYDLRNIVGKGDRTQNVPLTGGEIVYVHAHDVAVMGQVNRPGKYSVEGSVRTVADFLSMAGGISPIGSDTVTLTTIRNGSINRQEIDVETLFNAGDASASIELLNGDSIYVPRAPMVYIYGEVQKPGSFRVERNMTVVQAIAQGGGITVRGTQRGIQRYRRSPDNVMVKTSAQLTDPVHPDDVIYIQESLF
jgi:polysaccharide export outer membrane protein